MISEEQALRLQAWVDDELRPHERGEVEAWLARDTEAQALGEELRLTARALRGNEVVRPLPESREFYWSKIARAIEREAAADTAVRQAAPGFSWRRWLIPAGGLAVVAAGVALVLQRVSPDGPGPAVLAVGHEIETPLEEVSSFTFRSESERMTVVWVNFRSP